MSRTTLRESRRSSNVLPGSHSQQYHSRGHSLTGFSIQTYENLDLFSISSRNLSVASSDESSNVSMKLGRYDVRSSELSKREVDDSSSSIDKGKHVYDWETDRSTSASTRSSSLARSVPSTEASKLSASEFSADHCTRPSRRSSQFSAYSSDRLSSVPHTSSASVLAYFGQSSPLTRSLSTPRSWASAGRVLLHRRTPAPAHRPSSPVPRLWSPQQPVVPLNRPPKIRSLPDRFLPVAAVTPKRNPETTSPRNVPRRYSRHMDINRNGTGTGTPQGFRAASEAQSVGSMGAPECINNTSVLENGNYMSSAAEITSKSIDGRNMSSQLKGQSQPSEMKRKE
ncbi:uncharacterized protein LOC110622575 isoform X1 [Manihot esculenta]|uniref:Uncharacterized protein n=1 Tax=Manihot esculenta TaxID=3983 RepID=A0ACB7H5D3_MANES|nr:uncharacterized protein LOC110622575 isoform X1 [Manihot esculenta]KAG8647893.1 hypothetical protein MANES_09G122450v8 [Manihot esculenta]